MAAPFVSPIPRDALWNDTRVLQFLEELRNQANKPKYYSQDTDPGTAGVPVGTWSIWLNTGTGVLKLWANQNGVMKSVTLT